MYRGQVTEVSPGPVEAISGPRPCTLNNNTFLMMSFSVHTHRPTSAAAQERVEFLELMLSSPLTP